MKRVINKYKVGETVLLHGREVTIERTGTSVNRRPVYLIGGVWYLEKVLTEWFPPCPM